MSGENQNKTPKSFTVMAGLTSAGLIASGFVQQHDWMFIGGGVAAVVAGVLSFMAYRPPRS